MLGTIRKHFRVANKGDSECFQHQEVTDTPVIPQTCTIFFKHSFQLLERVADEWRNVLSAVSLSKMTAMAYAEAG